jgi:dTDP-4-amino-4,6-dideoxygalactose transaminase
MNKENKRIYLSPPHMGGNELTYIKKAFDSNWIAPLGPNVDAFEKSLADYCGVTQAAALSSGTSALHLSLIALGVKRDDEVIASTFTFSATINPIIYLGAIPVLVDSESETWNMSPDLLETAIKDRLHKGKKPRAIIPVHLYGMPANMSSIMEIANHYEIPVIEDAAEALGSRYRNKPLGSFGKTAVLSFNGNKIITTSGGGALISNDEALVAHVRFLATQARDEAPHYQHSQVGYNYRMSNVVAGVGLGQMEVLNERVRQRRENFKSYVENFGKRDGITFLKEPGPDYFSNHWLTAIVIDPRKTGITREDLRIAFEKDNIDARPLWKPMHLQPVYSHYPAYVNNTSEALFNHGLCLPSGSNMSESERQRIYETINRCLGN